MTSIGAEVGQKMRSAIKAKLLELNCYVDDELPDYVMVMVANKRTKSQMKEDLQLFLTTKTGTFVDWLHIVLKKLKEVTVTNPEVYKKTVKRKSGAIFDADVKKEKKEKKLDRKLRKAEESFRTVIAERGGDSAFKSLTDDLPINANKLAEQRKIIIMKENQTNNSAEQLMQDTFDIPLLSEVNMSTEEELENIERKIKSVKSRLGLLVDSGDEGDCINLKAEPDELFGEDRAPEQKKSRKMQSAGKTPNEAASKRPERARITFAGDKEESPTKRKSVLERLGKRRSQDGESESLRSKRSRITFSEFRKEDERSSRSSRDKEEKRSNSRRKRDKLKESVLNRLGVMSKVSVPQKPPQEVPAEEEEEEEEPFKEREVPSAVKVKPRVVLPDSSQANKNLLLKAVAEAQRSIAQTPKVGKSKPDALFTKRYKERRSADEQTDESSPEPDRTPKTGKAATSLQQDKPKAGLGASREVSLEYVPAPVTKTHGGPQYVPSAKSSSLDSDELAENGKVKQQFIVTLDGIEKAKKHKAEEAPKPSVKARLDRKRSPSPIIFDKVTTTVKSKSNIPDKLPMVHAPPSIKNKERCKYWPSCRQGDKCEFVHPAANCDLFPRCKFKDKCLYLHPSCKFGSSCTRRDCPYSHAPVGKSATRMAPSGPSAKASQVAQTCKFFPNCTNLSCTFYHPKPCKFGKYCKNQAECNFSHSFARTKGSLTWRSK